MDGLRAEQTKRNSRDIGKVLVTRVENLFKVPTVSTNFNYCEDLIPISCR
jgi:hypothetical protein